MLLLGCFLDKCWMCTATAMTGHSALLRYAFSVSMRQLQRLLCYAIFLLRDLRAGWLVLAARCSIAKVDLYCRRSIAAARVSESSLQTPLVCLLVCGDIVLLQAVLCRQDWKLSVV